MTDLSNFSAESFPWMGPYRYSDVPVTFPQARHQLACVSTPLDYRAAGERPLNPRGPSIPPSKGCAALASGTTVASNPLDEVSEVFFIQNGLMASGKQVRE